MVDLSNLDLQGSFGGLKGPTSLPDTGKSGSRHYKAGSKGKTANKTSAQGQAVLSGKSSNIAPQPQKRLGKKKAVKPLFKNGSENSKVVNTADKTGKPVERLLNGSDNNNLTFDELFAIDNTDPEVLVNDNCQVLFDHKNGKIIHVDWRAIKPERRAYYETEIEAGRLEKKVINLEHNVLAIEEGVDKKEFGEKIKGYETVFNEGASEEFKERVRAASEKELKIIGLDQDKWESFWDKYDEAFDAMLSRMLDDSIFVEDSVDYTVETQLEELGKRLTSRGRRGSRKEKEIKGKEDKEEKGKERVSGRESFKLRVQLEEIYQKERDNIKHHEEQVYLEVIKILDFITKELRKGEVKEWDQFKMVLRSELKCEEFLLEEIDERLIDQLIDLIGHVASRDPSFARLAILVFKVSCSSMLAGLPSALSFSAEKAEGGKVKKVAIFTEKDVRILEGIDPALYPKIKPLFDLSVGVMRAFDTAISSLLMTQLQSSQRQEPVESDWVFPLQEEWMAEASELLKKASPSAIENRKIVADRAEKFTFLRKPVSEGSMMREEANRTFLPDQLNAQKVQKQSRADRLPSTKRVAEVAATSGSLKRFSSTQAQAWKNRKVVDMKG